MEIERQRFFRFDHDPGTGSLSFLWTPETEGMTDEDFKQGLRAFALAAARTGSSRLLVDLRGFRHRPGDATQAWRGAEITPLYNLLGVSRFAYVLPEGAPAPGPPGIANPGEDFATGFFAAEAEARAWLLAE